MTGLPDPKRITQDELIELFGASMPIEAYNVLFGKDNKNKTVDQVRLELKAMSHSLVNKSAESVAVGITERVPFRLIQTPCCSTLLCWVNPRFPTYCPECGKHVYREIRGCVVASDDNALLKVKAKPK